MRICARSRRRSRRRLLPACRLTAPPPARWLLCARRAGRRSVRAARVARCARSPAAAVGRASRSSPGSTATSRRCGISTKSSSSCAARARSAHRTQPRQDGREHAHDRIRRRSQPQLARRNSGPRRATDLGRCPSPSRRRIGTSSTSIPRSSSSCMARSGPFRTRRPARSSRRFRDGAGALARPAVHVTHAWLARDAGVDRIPILTVEFARGAPREETGPALLAGLAAVLEGPMPEPEQGEFFVR